MIKKKSFFTGFAGAVILSLVLSGCSFGKTNGGLAVPEMENIPEIRFVTREVLRQDIKKEVREVTKIQPANQTLIFTKYGGWLKAHYGEVNKFVTEGELLAEFDSDSLELKYKEYEVSLEKLKTAAKNSLEQINRELSLAMLDLENIEKKLNELEEKKKNVISDGLTSDVKAIEDQIAKVQREVVVKQMSIEGITQRYDTTKTTYEIDIKRTEDQLDAVSIQLADTKLYAPKDSMIFSVNRLREGEYVNPYQSLMSLVSIEDIQLVYSGMNASKFEVGMKVTFTLDGNELPGEVISSPAYYSKDASAGLKESVIFKIIDLDVETLLSLKSDIRVNLILEESTNAIVIPKSYLKNHLGNRYVYILEDGMKKMRFVETGIENNVNVEILKGLNEGDLLVD